eukprot:SAG31_NODE_2688_length_5250_cov_11.245583_6_plen_105_part_00
MQTISLACLVAKLVSMLAKLANLVSMLVYPGRSQVLEDLTSRGASAEEVDALTYGEIMPAEFDRLLSQHCCHDAGGRDHVFYDLGCGTAKYDHSFIILCHLAKR